MCAFYVPNKNDKANDFNFDKNQDFIDKGFIAVRKFNPFIEKWYFLVKNYWNNRREVDRDISGNELFKNLPQNLYIVPSILQLAFRKLIG